MSDTESPSYQNAFETEFEILRQRFIVDYTSFSNKNLREEFTLKCVTDRKEKYIDNIIIVSPKFLPNLKVYDADGTQLPLITNKLTKALIIGLLRKLSHGHPRKLALGHMLANMERQEIFVLWIKLPNSNRFYLNESRIFFLEYEPSKEDDKHSMEFHSSPHEVFYVITPPEDFNFGRKEIHTIDLKNERVIKKETSWKKKKGAPYYFTESQKSVSVRIHPNFPYQYRFIYSFKPRKTITTLPWLALGLLITGSIIILLSNLEYFFENCNAHQLCWITLPVENRQSEFGIGIIGASLVVPRLIRNIEARDLMKFWFIIPIGITIIGLYISHILTLLGY